MRELLEPSEIPAGNAIDSPRAQGPPELTGSGTGSGNGSGTGPSNGLVSGSAGEPALEPARGAGGGERLGIAVSALLGGAAWALLAWAVGRTPVEFHEPVGLRLARAWAEHGVRTPLALTLLLLGLARLFRRAEGPGLGPRHDL